MNREKLLDMRVRGSEDLCLIAEELGYKSTGRFAINQLQCNNGAFVSSLLSMLDDNPGLMENIQEWLSDNHPDVNDDEDEECEEVDEDDLEEEVPPTENYNK